jgi:hypothetical protein
MLLVLVMPKYLTFNGKKAMDKELFPVAFRSMATRKLEKRIEVLGCRGVSRHFPTSVAICCLPIGVCSVFYLDPLQYI